MRIRSSARAFDLVLNRKGVALDLQLRVRALNRQLSEKERRALEELSGVRSELAGLMISKPSSVTNEEYAQKVTLLFERGITLENAFNRFGSRWDQIASMRIAKSEVAANLRPGTALIEFVRVRDEDPARRDVPGSPEGAAKYLAFVLMSSGQLSLAELGAAQAIDELVADFQSSIRAGGNPALVAELLKELHVKIWAPLEGFLGGVQDVVVSPDGELHRIPFAALMDAKSRYIIDRYRFAYVGSARDLLPPRSKPTAPARRFYCQSGL